VNKEGWEKDTDARRWSRFIVDRRRGINRLPVSIRPIHTPATNIVVTTASAIVTVAVIPTASVIVTTAVMSYPAVTIIFSEGLRHVNTSYHCG
jgi:hypothetical protein